MNTLSILTICAFLYLAFVTYMFRNKGGKAGGGKAQTKEPYESEGNTEDKSEKKTSRPLSIVPQSDFDMDRFQQMLTASVAAAVTYVLKANVGDVNPQDVEFKDEASGNPGAEKPDTPDDTPDMENFNPDSVSPPATGDSIDEIEAAIAVAVNAKATPDEKAKAGNVLTGMQDVVFIGKMMAANEKINEGIMACVAESMRRTTKKKRKGPPAPKKKNKPIDVGGTFRDLDMIKRDKDEED